MESSISAYLYEVRESLEAQLDEAQAEVNGAVVAQSEHRRVVEEGLMLKVTLHSQAFMTALCLVLLVLYALDERTNLGLDLTLCKVRVLDDGLETVLRFWRQRLEVVEGSLCDLKHSRGTTNSLAKCGVTSFRSESSGKVSTGAVVKSIGSTVVTSIGAVAVWNGLIRSVVTSTG